MAWRLECCIVRLQASQNSKSGTMKRGVELGDSLITIECVLYGEDSTWTGLRVMPVALALYFLAMCLLLPPTPHPTSTIYTKTDVTRLKSFL